MINPFQAILKQDITKLNEYLLHGNVNCHDNQGRTLLHLAIKLGNTEAVQLLLKAYIDIDWKDNDGNTAFHYAVLQNRISYLRVLFTTSGNPMTKNKFGQTPLYLACRYAKEQCIDLYLEKYKLDMGEKDLQEETIFMAFVRSKSISLLKKYGSFDSWIDEVNYLGNTPLIVAAKTNSYDMVSFLLEQHAFVNQFNHDGETALFYAVRNANKKMIDLFLQHGAFLDFKNRYLETIFSCATSEIKEYIEDRVQQYHLDTYKKKYPLHYALYIKDDKRIAKYMTLKHVYIEDDFGYTPELLAKIYHNKFALEKLKEFNRIAKIAAFETK